MISVIEVRAMNSEDANELQAMMFAEQPSYLTHFTAFDEPDSLLQQCISAKHDAFFTLFENNSLAGFFCLRGIDKGYSRPSFGVYVTSKYQGKGLARAALREACLWCKKRSITNMILKVANENIRAKELYEQSGFVTIGMCAQSGQIKMEKRIN